MQVAHATVEAIPAPAADSYLSYEKLRKHYLDYCNVKRGEIEEQREARHYYHADQYTDEQRKTLRKRKQPIITINQLGRKIDGVVGLIERLRQDPKAYPRTPQHEDGAEIASAALRYALDKENWPALSSEASRVGAVDGIGGIELSLEPGDSGDQEVTLAPVDIDTFFYDPRSFRPDFSDARFMGVSKWVDLEAAQELFPEHADLLASLIDGGGDIESNAQQDRERKWIDSEQKRIRINEHWYKHKGQWCYSFYVRGKVLKEGYSPFVDEKGQTICRFIMFSANVDYEGDRYGFVRNLKSLQDEINARRSKALHLMHSRRILARRGALADPEKARREAARADGLIEWDVEKPEFEDAKSQSDLRAQVEMMQITKADLEGFGPNPQLVGETRGEKSGRAIALLQQAGIAELGPYIIAIRDWKIRVYRSVWNAIQQHWSSERWVRVTDDEGLAQFLKINELRPGPYGPQLVNALGQLDVDIILDEGPDNINAMQDAFDILVQGLAQNGVPVPPKVLIKLAQLPSSVKKEILAEFDAAQQPDPMAQQAKEVALAGEAAKVIETQSKTIKNMADAGRTQQQAMMAPYEFAAGRDDAQTSAALAALRRAPA